MFALAALLGACAEMSATAEEEPLVFEFDVGGMACDGCAAQVRNAVARVDGVESCDVSYERAEATVQVKDEAALARILEAVRKLDFTIEQRDRGPERGAEYE